jgi:hypothetical protein
MKRRNRLLLVGGIAGWVLLKASAQAPQGDAEFPPASPRPVEQVLKRIQQRNPEEFARLTKLRQENPEAFRKALKERLDKARRAAPDSPSARDDWMRKYPEFNQQEAEIRQLAESHKAAAPSERGRLAAELKRKIGENFALREKLRQEMIQRCEAQLIRLKKDVAQGLAQREAIVERRFAELTADAAPSR